MNIISCNSPNIPNEAGTVIICTLQMRKLEEGLLTLSCWLWKPLPGCPAGSWWGGSLKACVPLSSQCISMVHRSVLLPWVRPGDTALLRGVRWGSVNPLQQAASVGVYSCPLPARWTGMVMRVPSAHLWLWVPKDSPDVLGACLPFCHMLQT